ncbi:MAG: NAD-dependent epimerase/dehydratase family protein [Blastocatellia bacterium]
MSSKRVILAGGSGFLGQSLAGELAAKGYEVIVLTRRPNQGPGPVKQTGWDGKSLGEWTSLFDGAAAVVNLTGKSVNCRYTPENRKEIIESRIDPVNVVGEAISRCSMPPKAWVQAGSLAIYGDAGDRICDENAPPGEGFPVETCLLWERAFSAIETPRTRKAFLCSSPVS